MKSENFVVIQGWMCNELNLKGNDLLVYALIYGFSQDGETVFSGSRSYIAKTFNISLPTVDKALNSLLTKNLIEKSTSIINGVTFNSYKITLQVVKNLYGGSKETLPNNISNNIVNKDISKDISGDASDNFVFGKKAPKQRKVSNSSEYEDALMLANNYSNNKELVSELHKFIDLKHEQCGKQRYKFWAKTIQNYLDELDKQFQDDDKQKIEAVKLSIRYNGTTKVMIPNYCGSNTIDTVTGMNNSVRNAYANEDQNFSEGEEY